MFTSACKSGLHGMTEFGVGSKYLTLDRTHHVVVLPSAQSNGCPKFTGYLPTQNTQVGLSETYVVSQTLVCLTAMPPDLRRQLDGDVMSGPSPSMTRSR